MTNPTPEDIDRHVAYRHAYDPVFRARLAVAEVVHDECARRQHPGHPVAACRGCVSHAQAVALVLADTPVDDLKRDPFVRTLPTPPPTYPAGHVHAGLSWLRTCVRGGALKAPRDETAWLIRTLDALIDAARPTPPTT